MCTRIHDTVEHAAVVEGLSSRIGAEGGSLRPLRPKDFAGLGDECKAMHDGDTNGTRNNLAIELDSLRGGAHV
jgi:hypothetical protein